MGSEYKQGDRDFKHMTATRTAAAAEYALRIASQESLPADGVMCNPLGADFHFLSHSSVPIVTGQLSVQASPGPPFTVGHAPRTHRQSCRNVMPTPCPPLPSPPPLSPPPGVVTWGPRSESGDAGGLVQPVQIQCQVVSDICQSHTHKKKNEQQP